MLTIKEAHSHKILQQGQCPHCGGDQFVVDPETHEITCSQCVLVLNGDLLSRKLASLSRTLLFIIFYLVDSLVSQD